MHGCRTDVPKGRADEGFGSKDFVFNPETRGNESMKNFAAAAIAMCILSAPASAQFGRLVPTDTILRTSVGTCVTPGTDFQRTVPTIAKRGKWDEYGTKPGTPRTTRGWLYAPNGQPIVVDIATNGSVGTCSVNAVSDPSAIVKAIRAARGAPRVNRTPNGDIVYLWPATKGRPVTSVTNSPGQAMTRVTVTAPAR